MWQQERGIGRQCRLIAATPAAAASLCQANSLRRRALNSSTRGSSSSSSCACGPREQRRGLLRVDGPSSAERGPGAVQTTPRATHISVELQVAAQGRYDRGGLPCQQQGWAGLHLRSRRSPLHRRRPIKRRAVPRSAHGQFHAAGGAMLAAAAAAAAAISRPSLS